MQPWIDELWRLAETVLATSTPWVMGVMILAGTLLFVPVYVKLADWMNSPNCGALRSVIVLALTVGTLAAATIAARFYLVPRFGVWSFYAAPVAGFLVAGLEVWLLTRTRYWRGLLALALGLVAAAGIMALAHTVLGAFAAGDRSVDRMLDRKEEARGVLR